MKDFAKIALKHSISGKFLQNIWRNFSFEVSQQKSLDVNDETSLSSKPLAFNAVT